MNTILGEIGKTQKFIDLNNQIENKKSPIQILGLTDVGMLQIIGGINEFDKKPICIITYNEIQAKKIYEDMGYQIYLMDKTINNEEFSNNVTQFDLLVSESDSSEDILTIEEVVLANYEEIFGTGM